MVVRFGPRAGMCGAVLKEGKMANTNSKPGASDADGHEPDRRDFIVVATYAMGAVGAGAVAWPLIDQMNPAADTLALASTEVDVSKIAEGQAITVTWRGKPVFIRHRTADEIARANAGLPVRPITLRQGDEFQDLANSLYRVLARLQLVERSPEDRSDFELERVRGSQSELLREIDEFDSSGLADADRQRLDEWRSRMRELLSKLDG